MKSITLLLALVCLSLSAAPKSATQDIAGLPRVLLLCDFVTINSGYLVRQKLAGKANVHVSMTTGRQTQTEWPTYEASFRFGKFDVIHFSCGLHIIALPSEVNPQQQPHIEPSEYEKGVRACVAFLKKTQAKLIFSTMTTAPEEAQVDAYNKIAIKVMKENGVAIDDLHAAVTPNIAKLQNPNDVHFNTEGSAVLGKAVVKSINAALAK